MNAVIKVIFVDLFEIFLSMGMNYVFYSKILFLKKMNLTPRIFVWTGAIWMMLFWYLLFYFLYCVKQYICPKEFYDLTIQIFAYAGLYLSMIITAVLAISALQNRTALKNDENNQNPLRP